MIALIGIGEDALAGLPPATRSLVEEADVLVGAARHLDLIADFAGPCVDWSAGFDAGFDAIDRHLREGRKVVVLASGDPLYFGVGKSLIARFGHERVRVLPHPSAVSLTCAAMGWAQADVQVVTVHGRSSGRSLENLNLYLHPGARLVVLTRGGESPAHIAKLLVEQGYGPSRLVVLEHLGGAREHRVEGEAETWTQAHCAALNMVAVEVIAGARARPLSRLAGLPDDVYEHDGQLTKRAVRAVTLSSLAPLPGETLWDLGAGAGSVAIEWMRTHSSCMAVAVERDAVRGARIERNAARLGVVRLKVEVLEVMDALKSSAFLSDRPDAIFVGGGVAIPGLLEAAWGCLKPGGRLVANAVTKQSAAALELMQQDHGGDLIIIGIENKNIEKNLFEQKRPITQYIAHKS